MWCMLNSETLDRKGMYVEYIGFRDQGEVFMLSILGSETKEKRGMHVGYVGFWGELCIEFRDQAEERYACGICWCMLGKGIGMHVQYVGFREEVCTWSMLSS